MDVLQIWGKVVSRNPGHGQQEITRVALAPDLFRELKKTTLPNVHRQTDLNATEYQFIGVRVYPETNLPEGGYAAMNRANQVVFSHFPDAKRKKP